jgi:hypothetical protein
MPSLVLGSPREYEQFLTNLITAIDNEEPTQIEINGQLLVDNINRLVVRVSVPGSPGRSIRPADVMGVEVATAEKVRSLVGLCVTSSNKERARQLAMEALSLWQGMFSNPAAPRGE